MISGEEDIFSKDNVVPRLNLLKCKMVFFLKRLNVEKSKKPAILWSRQEGKAEYSRVLHLVSTMLEFY